MFSILNKALRSTNRVQKVLDKKAYEKFSIAEIITFVPHCQAMNKTSILKKEDDRTDGKVWLNPHNQLCFNAGWYSHQDFVDWANGTGNIIKGKTQKEKDIFMHYHKCYVDEKCGWETLYGMRFAHLFEGYFKYLPIKNNFNYTSEYETIDPTSDKEEIIKKVFGSAIFQLKFDMETSFDLEILRRNWHEESFGISKTLCLFNIGSFGASNTPEKLINLSWVRDVCWGIAKYLNLKEKGYEFPDVEFVEKNRYK